ncbi:MAG: SoxR reducing system RseC family protein [Azonexaceae bacterium]|nr:SoxR reducing system RseC family protein [Azonexaceae bacterium]
MSTHTPNLSPANSNAALRSVEGIARVVRIEGDQAWLEPEQTTSCGHCASSASCGVSSREEAGIGTVTSRLQARRFHLDNPAGISGFREGERLVVGVSERALLNAALTAYGLPLLFALVAGGLTQAAYGEDLTTMLGMSGGLALGLLAARLNARRLAARGDLAPRFLRRARPDETCGTV